MKKIFTLFLVLITTTTLWAYDFKVGDLCYNITSNTKPYTVKVTGAASSITTATIPASVTYNGATYSVTSIGNRAFKGCSSLTSVNIPNSVTSIEEGAFLSCSSLTSVTIGNSVTSIGDRAFSSCSSLTSVTIGNSVTSIGDRAFNDCSSLTKTNYTGDIAGWCDIKFGGSTANPMYYSHNFFINDQEIKDLVIPNTVDSIHNYAFYKCTSLTSITIPNSVTSIGDCAFSDCSSLTSVTIPNSVTSIGSSAFSGCSSLTSVTIPNSVTSIGSSAFVNCSSLTSVTIPNSVTNIGYYAFKGCSSLTSITLPESVTSIGYEAFRSCSSLTSITIPNSVTSIGDYAFKSCYSLTSVTIGNSVTSIGNWAFSGCPSLTKTNYTGDIAGWCDIKFGGSYANPMHYSNNFFINDQEIKDLVIPNSVTSIGDHAFANCSSLTSITCEATTPPAIGENAFDWVSYSIPVYVPCGRVDAYKAAEDWKDFTNIQELLAEYSIEVKVNDATKGTAKVDYNTFCEGNQISATPNIGYHFVQWSDGSTYNPRTLVLTQDTILTAEFAANKYFISTVSNDPKRGTTSGDTLAAYWDYVTISATAKYGYHFSSWENGNADNPRQVQVTGDKEYMAYFDKNTYTVTTSCDGNYGTVSPTVTGEYLDTITLTATPTSGYHFSRWSDGNTDNPRTLVLTQDTILTAEFAANKYLISTVSNDPKRGTTSGDTLAAYLDYVTISATAKYGYHFSSWENGNADNPRQVQVTGDKEYMAYFDKNTYTVTTSCDGNYGTVSPTVTGEYLDTITLTATPTSGYHFSRWSDGNTQNPRKYVVKKDVTLTAEFALTVSGQCGDNLYWAYNESDQSIAITGTGDMYNYTSGTQPWILFLEKIKKVTTDNTAASLGTSAFEGAIRLAEVHIGAKIDMIEANVFAGCNRLRNIYCYPTYPPIIRESSFARYDALLYIPCDYLDDYVFDRNWKKFENIQCAGAEKEEIESDDVDVDPSSTSVTMTWPTEENANTYTIEIMKGGALFCRLVFNTTGQLLNISFAPSRDGNNRPVQYAEQVANGSGLRFTVTGLNERTHYTYDLRAKDKDENTIQSHSGEFTTKSNVTTDMDNIQSPVTTCQKIMRNGQLIILRDGKTYTTMGAEIQ